MSESDGTSENPTQDSSETMNRTEQKS